MLICDISTAKVFAHYCYFCYFFSFPIIFNTMDPIGNKPSGFNGLSMVHSMSKYFHQIIFTVETGM